jgi:hypothetical protein
MQDGHWRQAEDQLRIVLDAGEGDAQTYHMLARCELRSGRAMDALGHARMAVDMEPDKEPYRKFLQTVAAQAAKRGANVPIRA